MSNTTDFGWMVEASCRKLPHAEAMRIFFPEKGHQTIEAKRLCLGKPGGKGSDAIPACPVKEQCLAYALSFEPEGVVGVWGGTTPYERRKMVSEPETHKPQIVGSYRNLDRLEELLKLVSQVNRGG